MRPTASSAGQRQPVVLHVGADAQQGQLLQMLFQMLDLGPLARCTRPWSALKQCARLQPDLLLVDYELPGCTGDGLLLRIRWLLAQRTGPYGKLPRAILLTDDPLEELPPNLRQIGFEDVWEKPVVSRQALDSLRAVVLSLRHTHRH